MFEQARTWLHKLAFYHTVKDTADRVESLWSATEVFKAFIVEKDFLNNKSGNSLAEFSASFHDAEAKRDNFCFQQVVNYSSIINFDQGANHPEGGQTQVLESPAFADSVEEWEGVEVNISLQK